MWVRGFPQNTGLSNVFVQETSYHVLWQRRERNGWHCWLSFTMGSSVDHWCPTQVGDLMRKLKREPRREKNMRLFTILLALELADKVGEQDIKLENLAGRFAKLGRRKLPWITVRALVTKLDWDVKKRNSLESEEREENVMVIDSKMDKAPHAVWPQIKRKILNSNYLRLLIIEKYISKLLREKHYFSVPWRCKLYHKLCLWNVNTPGNN